MNALKRKQNQISHQISFIQSLIEFQIPAKFEFSKSYTKLDFELNFDISNHKWI